MVSGNNKELANQTYSLMSSKDKEVNDLLEQIINSTEDLSNQDTPLYKKYKVIVGVEYLLVRARLLVESEHIKVKQILSQPEITIPLKAIFTKRDQYLAQVCLKLTSIREDIASLQKVVYTANNFNMN